MSARGSRVMRWPGDAKIAPPTMTSWLKTALPTTVPVPTSFVSATKVAMSSAINSGAELPAAIKVAPATAGGRSHTSTMRAMATAK